MWHEMQNGFSSFKGTGPGLVLKETYYAHFKDHNFILVYYSSGIYTLYCSKNFFFLSLPSAPLSESYPECSDWPAATCLSQHHSPYLQSALSCFHLPLSLTSTVNIGDVIHIMWHGDVLWCHTGTELKAGLLMRRFRNLRSNVSKSPFWNCCSWDSCFIGADSGWCNVMCGSKKGCKVPDKLPPVISLSGNVALWVM